MIEIYNSRNYVDGRKRWAVLGTPSLVSAWFRENQDTFLRCNVTQSLAEDDGNIWYGIVRTDQLRGLHVHGAIILERVDKQMLIELMGRFGR